MLRHTDGDSPPGSTLIVLPDRNHHRRDYTGAFLPEAKRYLQYVTDPRYDVVHIDISKPMKHRKAQLYEALEQQSGPISTLVFFCHGYTRGLQMGLRLKDTGEFAERLSRIAIWQLRVALYACSAGGSSEKGALGGDGGFADLLRDALCRAGLDFCQVDAHTTKGHTTRNPYVRRFSGDGSAAGGQGGNWIVRPRSPLWAQWRKSLRGSLRFRFPGMPLYRIHDELMRGETTS